MKQNFVYAGLKYFQKKTVFVLGVLLSIIAAALSIDINIGVDIEKSNNPGTNSKSVLQNRDGN